MSLRVWLFQTTKKKKNTRKFFLSAYVRFYPFVTSLQKKKKNFFKSPANSANLFDSKSKYFPNPFT